MELRENGSSGERESHSGGIKASIFPFEYGSDFRELSELRRVTVCAKSQKLIYCPISNMGGLVYYFIYIS